MAVFTATEAKACKILDSSKNFSITTGAFTNYSFLVEDALGNQYEWTDSHATLNFTKVTGVGLTPWQVGVYVYNYLTGGALADGSASYAGATKLTSTPKIKKGSSQFWKGNVVELSEEWGFINSTVAFSKASVDIGDEIEIGDSDEESENLINDFETP